MSIQKITSAAFKIARGESSLRNLLGLQKRTICNDNKAQMQYDEQESQFSDQELNMFKKLFLKYDRDENCKLDRWEFNQFAKFLIGRSYNSIDLEKVMRQVDKNRDSFISYPELMHHMSKRFRPQHKERVAVAFNFFDKDSDGRLEFWETKQAVLYLGEHILAPEFRYKFDQIDTDQDGKITWVEFCRFLCKSLRNKEM
ncbi:Calcium Hypothetical protein protein [Nesidiocoris tenuis]|uniref:EF-hand domain-containing protein n=1 Tax=Nesidiocoris tenuis TaxID=355587 RepID=A0ABN7B3N8_9HEMI|nr:Calcium Hypothetical protein protein [Nesidiocoris tenuis]